MTKSYRDLNVWQKSFTLVKDVYAYTALLPANEKYGIISQIQRAAVSIPSNIAEGQQRGGVKEFRQFLHIARGSAAEISPAQQQFLDYLGLTLDIFRSPGLTEGQIIQDVLASLGMCNIFTDTDPHDWAMPRLTSQEIIMNVSNQLHPGLILLLHDGGSHTQTVNAMQGIIDVANAQGYTFVTMKQMMQAAKGAVFTTQHAELYEPRPVMPDYSLDTFDRVNELARIGLTAS